MFSIRRRYDANATPAASMLDASGMELSPVIDLPAVVHVHDFTAPPCSSGQCEAEYSIGKYDEERLGMYESELFAGNRFIHVGIDIGAPDGTPVSSFADGVVFSFGVNSATGDYGPTIITQHNFNGVEVWALYGHLSSRSLDGLAVGDTVLAGQRLAWLGKEHENGGWPPHLHFQLSLQEPEGYDLPGVVSQSDRATALKTYPDPRIVLGQLY